MKLLSRLLNYLTRTEEMSQGEGEVYTASLLHRMHTYDPGPEVGERVPLQPRFRSCNKCGTRYTPLGEGGRTCPLLCSKCRKEEALPVIEVERYEAPPTRVNLRMIRGKK